METRQYHIQLQKMQLYRSIVLQLLMPKPTKIEPSFMVRHDTRNMEDGSKIKQEQRELGTIILEL